MAFRTGVEPVTFGFGNRCTSFVLPEHRNDNLRIRVERMLLAFVVPAPEYRRTEDNWWRVRVLTPPRSV